MDDHHGPTPKRYKKETPLNSAYIQTPVSCRSICLMWPMWITGTKPHGTWRFNPPLRGRDPSRFPSRPRTIITISTKVRLTHPAGGYQGLKAKSANSDAKITRNTYCVNNFGHNIFRDINMSMNGVLMTEQSNTYHYKPYAETLLNYNREEGATKLAAQVWVNQLNVIEEMGATGANTDVPNDADWKGNEELRELTSRLLRENWHTFIIRPHLPPLKTGKCLVPGVQLDFELFLNPNTIYLMGTPKQRDLERQEISCHQ